MGLKALEFQIEQWHKSRNLIEGSSDAAQLPKLYEEFLELSEAIREGTDLRDHIGDMIVVMINMTCRNGITLEDCIQYAYDEIKDRKGKMVDGIFVKE